MFISNKLIYCHLQKTAGTHLSKVFAKYLIQNNNNKIQKHSSLSNLKLSNEFIVGSIRNPFSWYLSLWAYGCQGRGRLMINFFNHYNPKHLFMTNNSISTIDNLISFKLNKNFYKSIWFYLSKDNKAFQFLYSDINNIENFRIWLNLIINTDYGKFIVGEGYFRNSSSTFCGLLTYRYLFMYCKNFIGMNFNDYKKLVSFHNKNLIPHKMIRMERIFEDFSKVLELIKIDYNKKELVNHFKHKTNSSKELEIENYYDDKSRELVYMKDKLIFDHYYESK